jgi:glycosyltransferase involved in cell wall biosynthesis
MNIGISLLHALPEIGGGWRYIENILDALSSVTTSHRFFIFCTEDSEPLVPRDERFVAVRIECNARSRPRRLLAEHLSLPRFARRYQVACLHSFSGTVSYGSAIPTVATVYDLKAYDNPTGLSPLKRIYLKSLWGRCFKRAALILPMSFTTADALVRHEFAVPARLRVICNSVRQSYRVLDGLACETVRKKYNLPETFWLYVANYQAHKNHDRLIRSFAAVQASRPDSWPLVLCGNLSSKRVGIADLVRESGLEGKVLFVQDLADAEMPALYNSASALVFPSEYEGGGLPVMEAMACGCPVLASDIPTTREAGAEAVEMFDPRTKEGITSAMLRFMGDAQLRTQCRREGLKRAAMFSAARVAGDLIEAYETAGQLKSRAATLG